MFSEAQQAALSVIVRAFADMCEMETGNGFEDWSEGYMEEIAKAFEVIGRPTAAERLRKHWRLVKENHGKIGTVEFGDPDQNG